MYSSTFFFLSIFNSSVSGTPNSSGKSRNSTSSPNFRRTVPTESTEDWLDTIYADWELSPSANLPVTEGLPVSLFTPDMQTIVDFTSNPDIDGAFSKAFNKEFFDVYLG